MEDLCLVSRADCSAVGTGGLACCLSGGKALVPPEVMVRGAGTRPWRDTVETEVGCHEAVLIQE